MVGESLAQGPAGSDKGRVQWWPLVDIIHG